MTDLTHQRRPDQTLDGSLYADVLSAETRTLLLAAMTRFAADRVQAMVNESPDLSGESIVELLRDEADALAGG